MQVKDATCFTVCVFLKHDKTATEAGERRDLFRRRKEKRSRSFRRSTATKTRTPERHSRCSQPPACSTSSSRTYPTADLTHPQPHISLAVTGRLSCLRCLDAVGRASGRASGRQKLSDGALAWLAVCSEVQIFFHMVRLIPLPSPSPIISHLVSIQTGFTQLTQAVLENLEKRPLNGCSSSSSGALTENTGRDDAGHKYKNALSNQTGV